jgi:hypothetical protein
MKNYHEMCDEISKALRNYLLFFAIIFTVIVLLPEIINIASNRDSILAIIDRQDILMNVIIIAIVPATQIVVAVLSSLFVNLEVHVTLDKYTFKLRKRSDSTLINALTEKCQEESCEFV